MCNFKLHEISQIATGITHSYLQITGNTNNKQLTQNYLEIQKLLTDKQSILVEHVYL